MKRLPFTYQGKFNGGFSLIEITIVLLLIGLILAIAIPSLNALGGADVRQSANIIRGLMREVYSNAALSGKPHRIVFDLAANTYVVQETTDRVILNPKDEKELEQAKRDEEDNKKYKRNYLLGPTFKPVKGVLGEVKKMPKGVVLYAVFTDAIQSRATQGAVPVYFFEGGYTQNAEVTVAEDKTGKNAMTVILEPLTGESYVEAGMPDGK